MIRRRLVATKHGWATVTLVRERAASGVRQFWLARVVDIAYEGRGRSQIAALRDLRPEEDFQL